MSKRNQGRPQGRPVPAKQESHTHVVHEERLSIRSGPLPAPQELAEYDLVVPGAADRIITRFEKQSDHRMNLETSVIKHDNVRAYLGMVGGFLLQAGVIWGTVKLGAGGHEWSAAALGGGGSVTGLSTIWASWRRSQERAGRQS